jgi:antitoxin ParD1/3/4
MNVSLTPELDRFVAGKVDSGRYNSASEVVREALRLLEEHDRARSAQLKEYVLSTRAPNRKQESHRRPASS